MRSWLKDIALPRVWASVARITFVLAVGFSVHSQCATLPSNYNRALALALSKAKEIAIRRKDGEVLPEHVFMALAEMDDPAMITLLNSHTIDGKTIRTAAQAKSNFIKQMEISIKEARASRVMGALASGQEPSYSPSLAQHFNSANSNYTQKFGEEKITPIHLVWDGTINSEGRLFSPMRTAGFDIARVKLDALSDQLNTKTVDVIKPSELLASISTDFTELARQGAFDPLIGREIEMRELLVKLSGRRKKAALLVGDPGVGKTAILEGLAQLLISEDCPPQFKGKRLLALDIAGLVGNTKFRGEFEAKVRQLLQELIADPNIILFIDEAHLITGAGGDSSDGSGGSSSLSNLFKTAMGRGQLKLVGATTWDEYMGSIGKDKAAVRRWGGKPTMVNPPSEDQAFTWLTEAKPTYEKAHAGIKISDHGIDAAVRMSEQYIGDLSLPDKAIDLVDEAAAMLTNDLHTKEPTSALKLKEEISTLESRERRLRIHPHSAALIGPLAARRTELQARLKKLLEEFEKGKEIIAQLDGKLDDDTRRDLQKTLDEIRSTYDMLHTTVGPLEIAKVVSRRTGIKLSHIYSEAPREGNIEANLNKYVVGHDAAKTAIADAVLRRVQKTGNPNGPVAVIHLAGSNAVAQKLGEAYAKEEIGLAEALTVIDMSKFHDQHSVSGVLGPQPGYVGYEQGGRLTEPVIRRPFSVLVLTNIDKAHPDAVGHVMTMVQDGKLTDSKGRKVDYRNTIILISSQMFSDIFAQKLGTAEEQKRIQERLAEAFPDGFNDLMHATVVIAPLTPQELEEVGRRRFAELKKQLAEERGITLQFEPAALEELVRRGLEKGPGPEHVDTAFRNHVETPLGGKLKNAHAGYTAHVDFLDGHFVFSCEAAVGGL